MYNLGCLSVKLDHAVAATAWYRRAANRNHPEAVKDLARLLRVRGEIDEALSWFRRAADSGDIDAMDRLGLLHEQRGELAEAESWYRRAADADSSAMRHLGWLLTARGELDEAMTWFQRAADAGNQSARSRSMISNVRWISSEHRRDRVTDPIPGAIEEVVADRAFAPPLPLVNGSTSELCAALRNV
ncbi:tetratricopeptide repeat protein [Nocardia xishanensis]|uniref:tetratricopeptide repeat protein n=1 Tax=Nocardia xishanensis TaxID=238964 RepID=UPI0035A23480